MYGELEIIKTTWWSERRHVLVRKNPVTFPFRPASLVCKGFGSYDESEQKDQTVDTDDSDAVNVHENDHDGSVEFEFDESGDALIDRLQEMKDDE